MPSYQVGVLAVTAKRKSKIVLVSTRGRTRSPRWIFPKGQREKGRKDASVALEEAFEEAGVLGKLDSKYIEFPTQNKKQPRLRLYRMKVRKVLKEWPENNERQRRIVTLSEAAKILPKELRPCLRKCI